MSEKRRIAPKKKSLTTSFFDIGKKDDQIGREMELFGVSLELCLARDTKRNVYSENENHSKRSLMSMFRGSRSNPGSVIKLSDNVRSCESLPTKSLENGPLENCERFCDPLKAEQSEHNYNRPYQDLKVPIFVYSCIEHLEENGLQKVGLFRVSSSKKRIKQLREEFDNGNGYLRIPVNTCPHDVATLLKEFLRDLPEPLLCTTLYSTFLETQRIRNRRLQLEAISHLIRLLPIPHRDTLYVLLVFLAKVAAHSDDVCDADGNCLINGNKMDSSNLATVFAPNILRNTTLALDKTREQQQMSDAINVVRTMIDHYEEMFKIPAELLDVLYSQMLDVCPVKLYELISTKTQLLKWNMHNHLDDIQNCSEAASLSDDVFENTPHESHRLNHSNQIHENITPKSKYTNYREELCANKNLQGDKDRVLTASLKISLPEKIKSFGNGENSKKTPLKDVDNSEPQISNNLVAEKRKGKLHKRQHLIPSSIRLNNN